MATASADGLLARLDRLPPSRLLWSYVATLAFGAFFEVYDIALTPYVSPALIQAGVFHKGAEGLFGMSDQASFAAATFAGLWIGTLLFSFVADRLGRKPVFVVSLLWYGIATFVMGLQSTALGIDAWRLIAGIGVGMQLVTIDCYLAELAPKALRGRIFAVLTSLQFLAFPVCAGLSLLLIGHDPGGVAAWRWLAFVPAVGAAGAWLVQRRLPESPRWLIAHDRLAEAASVVMVIERQTERLLGRPLPRYMQPDGSSVIAQPRPDPTRLWQPPYRGRLVMMTVFHLLQTVGFYGVMNWVPAFLESKGADLKDSLAYTAAIALTYPVAPLVFYLFADRIERKWQVAGGALAAAVFGIVFAEQTTAAAWIVFGILVTAANNLMSYGYHTYQSELFPTEHRAQAVGTVYSFSRLSAILSSYLIGWILTEFGVTTVFLFIGACMTTVAVVIGVFGPRTSQLSLEQISIDDAS